MLPPFDPDTGRLPPGEHVASWDEVVERFGWNERRRRLLDGLATRSPCLVEAGCRRVWLNGSFVTAKDEPGDFDACWAIPTMSISTPSTHCCWTSPTVAEPRRTGSAASSSRTSSKPRSGLSFAEFFQNERDTSRKGIVVIDLTEGAWIMITNEVQYRATKAHLERFEQAAANLAARQGKRAKFDGSSSTPSTPRPTTCEPN